MNIKRNLTSIFVKKYLPYDVLITIIEQNRKDNKSNEQKKDLLRRREIFWQKKPDSIQPNGLIFQYSCGDLYKVLDTQNGFNIRCKGLFYRKFLIDTQLRNVIKQFTDEIT